MRPTIDAVISFAHNGSSVTARVARTTWNGSLSYVWQPVDGGAEFSTVGLPAGFVVVADV